MAEHVNTGLTLFEYYAANQRLILTVRRFHIHKRHFVKDWSEAFYLKWLLKQLFCPHSYPLTPTGNYTPGQKCQRIA